MNPQSTANPSTRPACVMLLTLWVPPAAPWHARLVGADARVHAFDSPFELARFVARSAVPPSLGAAPHPSGLR